MIERSFQISKTLRPGRFTIQVEVVDTKSGHTELEKRLSNLAQTIRQHFTITANSELRAKIPPDPEFKEV